MLTLAHSSVPSLTRKFFEHARTLARTSKYTLANEHAARLSWDLLPVQLDELFLQIIQVIEGQTTRATLLRQSEEADLSTSC